MFCNKKSVWKLWSEWKWKTGLLMMKLAKGGSSPGVDNIGDWIPRRKMQNCNPLLWCSVPSTKLLQITISFLKLLCTGTHLSHIEFFSTWGRLFELTEPGYKRGNEWRSRAVLALHSLSFKSFCSAILDVFHTLGSSRSLATGPKSRLGPKKV